jgi:hypothetical protein
MLLCVLRMQDCFFVYSLVLHQLRDAEGELWAGVQLLNVGLCCSRVTCYSEQAVMRGAAAARVAVLLL